MYAIAKYICQKHDTKRIKKERECNFKLQKYHTKIPKTTQTPTSSSPTSQMLHYAPRKPIKKEISHERVQNKK